MTWTRATWCPKTGSWPGLSHPNPESHDRERVAAIRNAVGDLEESGVPAKALLPLYEYLARLERPS